MAAGQGRPAAQAAVDEFAGIPKRAVTGAGVGADAAAEDEFAGIPKRQVAPTAKSESLARRQAAETRRQSGQEPVLLGLEGIGQQAIRTAQGFAAPIRRAFGMEAAPPAPTTNTTAEHVGQGVEQAGELFIPAGLATKFATKIGAAQRLIKLGMGARAATILGSLPEAVLQATGAKAWMAAQGADAHSSNVGAGIAAASPVVGAVAKVGVPMLREGARRGVEKLMETGISDRVLARAPGQVNRILPNAVEDTLKEPTLRQAWTRWTTTAGKARDVAGKALETVLAGPAGDEALPKAAVFADLDAWAAAKGWSTVPLGGAQPGGGTLQQQIVTAGGATQVPKNRAILKAVRDIKKEINDFPGDYVSARDWHFKKKLWDETVFGNTTANATPLRERLINAARQTELEAANSVRRLFATQATPTVAQADALASRAINYHEIVMKAAAEAEGVSPAWARNVSRSAAGAFVGGISGGIGGYETRGAKGAVYGGLTGILGGALAGQIARVTSSPAWKLLPAATKRSLADAVVSGQADRVRRIVAPLLTSAASGGRASVPSAATSATSTTPPPAQDKPQASLTGLEKATSIGADTKAEATRKAIDFYHEYSGVLGTTAPTGEAAEKILQFLPKALPKLTATATQVLRKIDNLGFDTVREAMQAIRSHPDWAERWNVSPADGSAIVEKWRTAHLLAHPPKASVWSEIASTIRATRQEQTAAAVQKSRAAMQIVPKP